MQLRRVIPVLTICDGRLVKTVMFRRQRYLGDPINAVRIFNDKCVDELVLLDIGATVKGSPPDLELVREIAGEAFIPLTYGGGVTSLKQMNELYKAGVEKIAINAHALREPEFVKRAADQFGSSSLVVSIDVQRDWRGKRRVVSHGGRRNYRLDPVEYACTAARNGAGEVFLNSIERDGTMRGYDLELIRDVAESVEVPVVACGGAGSTDDLGQAIKEGKASAAAAGSLFVFYGKHKAVLISFPTETELAEMFGKPQANCAAVASLQHHQTTMTAESIGVGPRR